MHVVHVPTAIPVQFAHPVAHGVTVSSQDEVTLNVLETIDVPTTFQPFSGQINTNHAFYRTVSSQILAS